MPVCFPCGPPNYNKVIVGTSGMEGSAMDCEPIYIDENVMVRTNHNVRQPMQQLEANRNHISGSILRHNRAFIPLQENYCRLTPEVMQQLPSDHSNFALLSACMMVPPCRCTQSSSSAMN
jgi:hypothetical protein